VVGALRGASVDFFTLAATVFAFGLVRAIMPTNVLKAVTTRFQGENLGMANGVVSMGMGVGLMLGPLISATVLSPLVGGWRNVLVLYGIVSVLIGVLWFVSDFGLSHGRIGVDYPGTGRIHRGLSRLVRIRDLWLLGLTLMLRWGCIMGVVGYLPLYLRERGWGIASADGALATFYAASMIGVVPLSLLSDRIGSRKVVLFPSLLTAAIGLALLPLSDGALTWVLVILVGVFMDAFMAILLTMVQETEGVGPAYSGTALGLVFTISHPGGFVSPPLGNSLASVGPGLSFVFWASLCILAAVTMAFVKETGGSKA
jgi:cyanate permease